ncbi:MAG: tRNA (adenosine(37)-N6)-dimethylallyltransferase MiaA [Rickettsiales bacterium]|jgi:tRNA dimethylallyltransferase|nr:tRNA (adenosine(37)-N6)-dimethylallyltransferase MiaA [Rickettsiales bacterium]
MAQKIIIYGPTCSGKTNLADIIAKELDAIIINSDSMQLYSEIPIISAQPDKYSSHHKLFAFLKGDQNFSVADWRDKAEILIDQYSLKGRNIVIVGGTGLYLKALLSGFKQLPSNTEKQRDEIDNLIKDKSVGYLYDKIIKQDSAYKNILLANDLQRVRRVYGLLFMHNISYQKYKNLPNISKYSESEFLKIYIKPEREDLYDKINQRVDAMMQLGAKGEVEKFLQNNYPINGNIYKAIGIREINQIMGKSLDESEALELMKKNTRNYAKRQITFFNHQIKSDMVLTSHTDFQVNLLEKTNV